MSPRSFKAKQVLFSVCVSGVILAAFAAFGLSVMKRIGLSRIDRELVALGDAQVRRRQPSEHWERFDRGLESLYGPEGRKQLVIKVNDITGARLYTSALWPADLREDLLGIADDPDAIPPIRRPPPMLPPDDMGMPGPGGRRPLDPEFRPPPLERGPPEQRLESHVIPARHFTTESGGRSWRFSVQGNEEVRLIIGQDLAGFQRELNEFRNAFLVAAPIALLFLAAGGWLLAHRALRPVQALTALAASMTARGLDQRVPTADADREFQALIEVINGMLNRLQRSFEQAVRFSADAAHELKTPLTILQGQLEQSLQEAPAGSPAQQTVAGLLEEVQRLKSIVRKLLLLAQADSGELRLSRERVDLGAEVDALGDDAALLAPGVHLERALASGVIVMADPDLLRQALQNLVSNAIKYNSPGGRLELGVRREGGDAVFTIANTTLATARVDPNRIFERFYRGDPARGHTVDGAGLGLSLAREIVRAHGGDLVLQTLRDDWIAFVLRVPASG